MKVKDLIKQLLQTDAENKKSLEDTFRYFELWRVKNEY